MIGPRWPGPRRAGAWWASLARGVVGLAGPGRGTDLVQYGYRPGTDLVQYGYSMGTVWVQVQYGYIMGTDLVQTWYSMGPVWVQYGYSMGTDLVQYGYMFCTCTELKYGYKNKTKFITPRPGEGLVY